MKSVFLKRILAYVMDAFIIALIASLFSKIAILNPYYDEYMEINDEYINKVFVEVNKSVEDNQTINTTAMDVSTMLDQEELENYQYKMSYYGMYASIITIVVTILYAVVFQYFNNGQTVGKALFKIRVVPNNKKKKISILSYFIRSIFVNKLLTDITLIVLVNYLSTKSFYLASNIVVYIEIAINLLIIGFITVRKDQRSIHDVLSKTKVILVEDEVQE